MDLDRYIELASEKWHQPIGLISALVAASLFPSLIPPIAWSSWHGLLALIACTTVSAMWASARSPPKTSPSKIGFAVSTYCSDASEDKRVREDFVDRLRQLVKSGHSGQLFDFLEVPRHLAIRQQEHDKAKELMNKCRAHFMIYSRVRVRNIKGESHHVFDLGGIVQHAPLQDQVRTRFEKEFSELFPVRINIPQESDLLAFEFSSEIAHTVAKYIIGIATALSHDLDHAEKMYEEVSHRISGTNQTIPAFKKIADRLPVRFHEIHEARATTKYRLWGEKKDVRFIHAMGSALAKIPENSRFDTRVSALRAIHAFVAKGDVGAALAYIQKHANDSDPIHNYNLAFLHGFEGNLAKSIRLYRKGATSPRY